MIEFKVIDDSGMLRIGISNLGDSKGDVLTALEQCSRGRCTCPTSQYEKLQSVYITPGRDRIDVALVPKAGEAIDRQAIDKCLEYTAAKVAVKH